MFKSNAKLNQLGPVAADAAINSDHPLNRGRVFWGLMPSGIAAAGSRVLDLTGKNHGTLNGDSPATPMWAPNQGEPATLTDGSTNQWVDIPSTPSLDLTGSYSLAVWINCSILPTVATYAGIVAKEDGSTATGYYIGVNGGGDPLNLYGGHNAGGNELQVNSVIALNTRYRIGVAFDISAGLRLYLNGLQIASNSTTTALASNTASLKIGKTLSGANHLVFGGLTRDAGVWNRALSAKEWLLDYQLSQQGYPDVLRRFATGSRIVAAGGGTTVSVPGVCVTLSIPSAVGAVTKSGPGRTHALSTTSAPGTATKAGPGRTVGVSIPRAAGADTQGGAGRTTALSIPRATGTVTKAGPGSTVGITTARAPGTAFRGAPGTTVSLATGAGVLAAIKAAPGRSTTLSIARAVAGEIAAAPGRIVCLTIARGSTSTGSAVEARAGSAVCLSIVYAGRATPQPEWERILTGATTVRARAAYQLAAFDYEDLEIFGSIRTLTDLSGAHLQFIGWDSNGEVAWDSEASPATATVEVTSATDRTYAATTTPKAAGVYKWMIRITNPGQRAVPVYGYLTIEESNTEAE